MKPLLVALTGSIFLSSCAGVPIRTGARLAVALDSLGLAAGFSDAYRVSESLRETQEGILVETLLARAEDGRVVRAQKLAGADAGQREAFIRGKLFQLRSIYEPHRDPYFSVLTKDTSCPARFRLASRKSAKSIEGSIDLLALYANDRMTYGACTDEQAVYRVFYAMLECRSVRSLFVIETFIPLSAPSEPDGQVMDSISCRPAR